MTALYLIGNTNLDTVECVAKAIRGLNKPHISKMFILNSSMSHMCLDNQVEIYRKYLGNVRYEELMLNDDGSIEQSKLAAIFKEFDNRIIDLTNGQKTTSSVLYMAACLCGIDDIYYLIRKPGTPDSSDYVKMQKFSETKTFGELSFFDLIYYNEEIDNIYKNIEKGNFHSKNFSELKTAVCYFFRGDYKNSISSATSGNEIVIKKFLDYLIKNSETNSYAKSQRIDLASNRDPVGILTYFYKSYLQNGKNNDVIALHAVPWIISALREFRNGTAHYLGHHHVFTYNEVRLVINMSIEMYKILQNNDELWRCLDE